MPGVPPVDGAQGGRQQAPVGRGPQDAACQPKGQRLPTLMETCFAEQPESVLVRGVPISQDDTKASLLDPFDFLRLVLSQSWMPDRRSIFERRSDTPVVEGQ